MVKILLAFSALAETDIEKMGDAQALELFLELLERQDIFILGKKDGPMVHALARHFGLLRPYNLQNRLDYLDPQLACCVLIQWRLLQIKIKEYEQKRALKKISTGSEINSTAHQIQLQLDFKEQ